MRHLILCIFFALSFSACGATNVVRGDMVRPQAMHDLRCANEDLQVSDARSGGAHSRGRVQVDANCDTLRSHALSYDDRHSSHTTYDCRWGAGEWFCVEHGHERHSEDMPQAHIDYNPSHYSQSDWWHIGD